MKLILPFIAFLTLHLNAQVITLTVEQEKNWDIQTMTPQSSSTLPFGEFIGEVVIPPASIQTISLPFEANIQQLYVAKHMSVKEGELLAKVTGSTWIEAQQEAIAYAIDLKEQEEAMLRKALLCKEGIIPQKECSIAKAKLDSLRVQSDAAKALLESYGAMPKMIEELYTTLKLEPTLPVISQIEGAILELNAGPGKRIARKRWCPRPPT